MSPPLLAVVTSDGRQNGGRQNGPKVMGDKMDWETKWTVRWWVMGQCVRNVFTTVESQEPFGKTRTFLPTMNDK
jgi:hypothetical protein